MKFITRYSKEAHALPFKFTKDSMTQQEYGYCLDINNIIDGCYNPFAEDPKKITEGMQVFAPDKIQEGMYQVAEAKSLFQQLPSKLRERFQNDPVKMLSFLNDTSNYDEAVKLGLVNPKIVEPPIPETVDNTVTPTPSGVSGA